MGPELVSKCEGNEYGPIPDCLTRPFRGPTTSQTHMSVLLTHVTEKSGGGIQSHLSEIEIDRERERWGERGMFPYALGKTSPACT